MLRSITVFMVFFVLIFSGLRINAKDKKIILASTFPVYQITRNITEDNEKVKVELLLPSQAGCPHSYSLTPNDMSRLTKANILIINGLGMEEFLKSTLKKTAKSLKIIDSSVGIKDLIYYPCTHSNHNHDHAHEVNPHLFVSPDFSAKIANTIATGLSEFDEDNAVLYTENAKKYAARMKKLSSKFAKLRKNLKNNRIIQPHGVFDYLARDAGLKIVGNILIEGQEPSAAEMIGLVRKIKKEKVGAIITEPQYPDKTAKTIARESKIPVIKIDPVATGPANSPLDYYDKIMEKNLTILKENLGKK